MEQGQPKVILETAKKGASISFSIYVLGTIGGVFICLLEVFRRIRFYNYARLPLWEGKIILASNHPSWLDIVFLPMLYFPWWYRELFERTKEIFTTPFKIVKREPVSNAFAKDFKDIPVSTADKHNFRHFRWVLEGWNIFIDRREDGIAERTGVLKKAADILDNDGRIVIFPGGGRDFKAELNGDGVYDIESREMIMRMPKPGMGWIVKQTGATVVPVRIEGADKVLPNKANEKLPPFLRFERYFLKVWHPINIKIGEPLRFPAGTDEQVVLEKYIQAQLELHQEGRLKKQHLASPKA